MAAILADKALAALSLGNIFEAQSSYREALDLARRMQLNYTVLALVYNNYGYLLYLLGDYPQAWKYYLQGLEVSESNNYEWFNCNIFNGQADILKEIGELSRAEPAYQKARQYAERFGKTSSNASALSGLVEIEIQRGDFNQAMFYLREMARIEKKPFEDPKYQLRLAMIYQAMGQTGLAQQTFGQLLTTKLNTDEKRVTQDRVALHLHLPGCYMRSAERADEPLSTS
jgi:tetratricopeptide (TPR) repeat protein